MKENTRFHWTVMGREEGAEGAIGIFHTIGTFIGSREEWKDFSAEVAKAGWEVGFPPLEFPQILKGVVQGPSVSIIKRKEEKNNG